MKCGVSLQGRKDSEAFSDGALCPAQAQKALKVWVVPSVCNYFKQTISLKLCCVPKGRMGQDRSRN